MPNKPAFSLDDQVNTPGAMDYLQQTAGDLPLRGPTQETYQPAAQVADLSGNLAKIQKARAMYQQAQQKAEQIKTKHPGAYNTATRVYDSYRQRNPQRNLPEHPVHMGTMEQIDVARRAYPYAQKAAPVVRKVAPHLRSMLDAANQAQQRLPGSSQYNGDTPPFFNR